ncbi:MAG: GNAT family N-acetyltransferase [Pikeienuella sp.]
MRRAEPGDIAQCLEIRRIVFIEEQGVDPALEIDGKDGLCRHWIAEQRGRAVATARALIEEGRAKIQRVAVLAGARGTGLGRQLMETVLADLRADPAVSAIWLESQVQALPFYERLGFVAYGARFLDAGIPHRRMLVPAAPEDVPALVAAFAARAEGALARLWAQPQREGAGEPERARLEADTRAAMASFAEEIAQLEQPSEELRLIDAMRRFFDALRAVDETAAEGFLGPEERDVLVPFAIELAALKGLRPSDWPHGDPTHGLRTI